MFQYQIMSEQEAMEERFNLLKEGEYDALVTASSDTQSKTGNPMMDMTVSVYDDNGKAHDVRDFLVFTKQMMWKIVHFADSAGLLKEYESGKLCSEVAINQRIRVKITVEPGNEISEDKLKGKPLGSRYPDKNKIEDYIKRGDADDIHANTEPSDIVDSDIPF